MIRPKLRLTSIMLFVFTTTVPALSDVARADLLNTTVMGQLYADNSGPYSTNLFDPANNNGSSGVPATGFENSAGSTVTISQTKVEFGYQDANNVVSADFGADTLLITDTQTPGRDYPLAFFFSDSAFANLNFSLSSYTFFEQPSYTYFSTGHFNIHVPYDPFGGSFTAVFTLASTPEPVSAGLLAIAALAMGIRPR